MSSDSDLDLDAILDQALDQFEMNLNSRPRSTTPNNNVFSEPAPDLDDIIEDMAKDEDMGFEIFENLLKSMPSDTSDTSFMDSLLNEPNSFMQTMLNKLISKEVLYEPMNDLKSKFPVWLEENEDKISADEYERYVTQFGFIEQIVHIYETQENKGLTEVMQLLQNMQDCGQPPVDIVKELAPGIQFDENGVPIFPEDSNLNLDFCSQM